MKLTAAAAYGTAGDDPVKIMKALGLIRSDGIVANLDFITHQNRCASVSALTAERAPALHVIILRVL